MMKYISNIGKIAILFGASAFGCMSAGAADSSMFPVNSPLAQGKWVKITIGETGVYEISYDELRAMGFSNPEKVGVYGRGGRLQPMQFVPSSSSETGYTSDLQPVAISHANNKIYFFGEDPVHIRYYTEMHNRANGQRFEVKSNNVFAKNGAYFLSDCGAATNEIETVTNGSSNSRLPNYTIGWDYFYHEKDEQTCTTSGREFFGESFKGVTDASFPYKVPGGVVGTQSSLVCRFVMDSPNAAQLTYGLYSGDEKSEGTVSINALGEYRYYMTADPGFLSLPLPGAEGEIKLSFTNPNAYYAALDYLLLGTKRNLTFLPGDAALRAYVYDFSDRNYRGVFIENAPENMVAWDVTNSNSVKRLPVESENGGAIVKYLATNKKEGMLVAFDQSIEQKRITGYEPVENQNLHALGADGKIPSMLIITLPELLPAAQRIADIHKDVEGIDVAIVLSNDVINEFSAGVPDPMAYRALAKMIYDRDNPDNRVFKNLLLLGPNIRDNRDILGITPAIGTLISNQSFLARDTDNTYCLNDWYGMMEDCTAYTPESMNFYQVPMQIGVGMLPCNTVDEAMIMADKVAASYADTSYAQWLGNYVMSADGSNDNEHQNRAELLVNSVDDISGNSIVTHKLYNNLYNQGVTKSHFKKLMKEGTFLTTYVGHASSVGLNSEFWNLGDEKTLDNRRLGFMNFAACSVSPFDNNLRGVGFSMLLEPNKGVVGSILTARSGFSSQNYQFMDKVQKAFLLNDCNSTELLSDKRTLGEAYAMAKTNINISNNEMAYHLIADPALVLPFPTASVQASINTNDGIYPGTRTPFSGSIVDRQGNLLSDFNGSVVLKLYAAPERKMTSTRLGSPSVEITLDETMLTSGEFVVKDGKFEGELFIPVVIGRTDNELASLRMSAYDPTTRTAALGIMKTAINAVDESKIEQNDNPPVITEMYINTPAYDPSMPVGNDFVLYAEIEDDHGLLMNDLNGMPSFYLMLDGLKNQGSLADASTVSEGGRKLHLVYPMSNLTAGRHTLMLTILDGQEHSVSRCIEVNVGPNPLGAALEVAETPAKEKATLTFKESPDCDNSVIDILDAQGCLVKSDSMKDNSYTWDLKDSEGKRVEPGIYYAVARMYKGTLACGVSDSVEIIVFKK